MNRDEQDYNEAFLISTEDLVEVDYIITMLREMDISYRALKDTWHYIDVTGAKSFDKVSIYVDENRLSEAKELLIPLNEKQQVYEEASDYEIDSEKEKQTDEENDLQQEVIRKYRRAFLYAMLTPAGVIFAAGIVIVFIGFVYWLVSFIISGGS